MSFNILGLEKAREAVNSNPDRIRTFEEVSEFVHSVNWRREMESKKLAVRDAVYMLSTKGYLTWLLNKHDNGINNWDDEAYLSRYDLDLSRFIEQKRLERETAGFIAVDRETQIALTKNGYFYESLLKFGVGIDFRHVK